MKNFFWFRRDLRLEDNAGFYQALKSTNPVQPIFIFDKQILDDLEDQRDPRVTYIYQEIERLREELKQRGSDILVKYGNPEEVWEELLQKEEIGAVYTNHDYEPYAKARDAKIAELCMAKGITFSTFKDQVIFEKSEILTGSDLPYSVFTPYSRKWKEKLNDYYLKPYPTEKYMDNLIKVSELEMPSFEEIGFVKNTATVFPERKTPTKRIQTYDETRDYPANESGTSRLGLHLRFGTISIRKLAREALEENETYLSELIWRDFYQQVLFHYPKVVNTAYKEKYDGVKWRKAEKDFEIWCEGKTGYPMVDAGMRELNETGYMHNRVRMVVASFLTKHLLIDWRWGEAYFAKKLLDFDLAANNGGWQWAAGSGTDAAPYFRIFNPESQLKKFDKDETYVRRWVPEYGTTKYPEPMVNHKEARERALETYKAGIN